MTPLVVVISKNSWPVSFSFGENEIIFLRTILANKRMILREASLFMGWGGVEDIWGGESFGATDLGGRIF